MNELERAYYQEAQEKAQEYSDSFVNDIKFNKQLLEDLSRIPNLVLCSQLERHLYNYHRFDYIYHLIFMIFSENPQKPNYDILGFKIDCNKVNIIRLLWEYVDIAQLSYLFKVPSLPNSDKYQEDIIEDKGMDFTSTVFEDTRENVSQNEEVAEKDLTKIDKNCLGIVNDVLQRVISVQASYGNTLSNQDKENIRAVIKSLIGETKVEKPLIIDLEMGKGKSLILLEFIKYMCEVDENFSAIIVKKTLEEAREFIIKLGLKDKEYEKSFCDNYEKLKKEHLKNEDLFIARMIRGFNRDECIQYTDALFGDDKVNENEFTYDLCSYCKKNECKVRQSKALQSQHRILVITHARLFLSNDCKEIMSDICQWQNEEGKKQDRKMLIIDEKIDTFYMDTLNLKQWTEIKNIIVSSNLDDGVKEQVVDVDKYLYNLPYPEKTNDIKSVTAYNNDFKFHESIIQFLVAKKKDAISIINALQKFLNDGGIVSRHWKGTKDELISYSNYIDVASYCSSPFEKCIILDATSKSDYDYCKCNTEFINGLKHSNDYRVNIYKSSSMTASKAKIIGNGKYLENVKLICQDIKDVIAATKGKSLVVVYKDMQDFIGNILHLKTDIENQLKTLEIDAHYKVIHFGQFTTGVNHLKDYDNIIIIGQLDKGTHYYRCKGLCLGKEASDIQINEYFIEMVQQIGRTGIRQGKCVDVYMLGANIKLIESIKNFFNASVSEWYLRNFNEFNTANETQRKKPWYKIVEYVLTNAQNIGDTVRKSDIQNQIVNELGVKYETYRSALKNTETIDALMCQGIISNPSNKREFIKIK